MALSSGLEHTYRGMVMECSGIEHTKRIIIGCPTTGNVRMEWVMARFGQIIPCNWSNIVILHYMEQYSPIDFQVPDARNVIANHLFVGNYEWLLFIDHDVIVPPDLFLKLNNVMSDKLYPVWAGIYFTKSVPSEPLIYKGRGNGHFRDWKFGDKVWVDGVHMGCTLIHRSIFEHLAPHCRRYVPAAGQPEMYEFYINPTKVFTDPEARATFIGTGTEDLNWCDRVKENDVVRKAGWDVPDYNFPFMMDTGVYCTHIDHNGIQYPYLGEDNRYKEVNDGRDQSQSRTKSEV